MTDRKFSMAIDRYVQGINHPFAPWNQPDYVHPKCENCSLSEEEFEACQEQWVKEPTYLGCKEVRMSIHLENASRAYWDQLMYQDWLLWETTWEQLTKEKDLYRDFTTLWEMECTP